ncbi:MAG: efflux RND transporter periplasmic adaptor subunit [Planctomycetota bacterium]|jgi:HlyD family secretion protein
MKKHWLWIVIVAGLVIGIWIFSAARPEATLEVVTPRIETLRAYVEEQAVTELAYDYLISMPISGWLQRIELREGDIVQKGQVLARLETDDLSDRVKQAKQRIAVLETDIKETQDHRLENNMLVETEAVVKAIDETVKAAEAQLEGSQALYDFAKTEVQRIKKLANLDAAAERELNAAKTELRKTGADHRSDVLELAALKTLAAVSYIGPKFINDYIDRKSFTLESYQRQLDEARAELEIQKRNLDRTQIKSPVAGVVLNRHQTRRQYLQAGTPLLTIGKMEDMEVVAEVLTERATRIQQNSAVEVFGKAIPDGPIQGKVLRVYPAGFKKISSLGVEQQRVKVAIKLDQTPQRLGVGFRLNVRIFYDQAKDALVLPRTCLFRNPEGNWQTMVVRQGKTELQPVELGLTTEEKAQITSGLNKNDQVVARPSSEITEGMKVKIKN